MKVLIIGSDGFIGSRVKEALADHSLYEANRSKPQNANQLYIDLTEARTIDEALRSVRPEIIVNCAGVVDNSEKAKLNPLFTGNLLKSVSQNAGGVSRILISGSASVYGEVDESNIPVDEDTPLNAKQGYGLSKLEEEQVAQEYRNRHGLPIVVTRIFNPIGRGMHPRLLVASLVRQVDEISTGMRRKIEVSRTDTKRDYINVKDVASAIKSLVENIPKESVYNIGSGVSTSNGELIELILKHSKIQDRPEIIQTFDKPEPLVAIQADINRIKGEFSWSPAFSIEETVKEVVDS